MTKEELIKVIKEDEKVFKSKDDGKILNILKKRAESFENIEEAFQYTDSVLKNGAYEFMWPEYYRIIVDNMTDEMIRKNLNSILEKMITYYNNEISNSYVVYEIENMINNMSQKIKKSNFETLLEFITGSKIENMSNLERSLLIEKQLPTDGINSSNYNNIFKYIDRIHEEANSDSISRITNSFIMELPEDIKVLEYENFSQRILELNEEEGQKANSFLEFVLDLPNEFLITHYEEILNTYIPLIEKNSILFRFDELLSKMFQVKDDQNIENEEISKALNFVIKEIENTFERAGERDEYYAAIVKSLPSRYIESNLDLLKDLFGEEIPKDVTVRLLDIIQAEILYKLEPQLEIDVSNNTLEHYERYFEFLLLNTDNAIIENDVAAQIFNLVNSKFVDTPKAEKFKLLLDKKIKLVELPNMNIYSKYIPKNYSQDVENMDSETFEKFCDDLKKVKLLKGAIPEEYCDFLINQKLNKNSNLNQNIDKYLPLFKRVFEDKTNYILNSNGIEGYRIEFFKDNGSGIQGYQSADEKKIGFLVDSLRNLDASNTHIINTMFHEIQHAIQAMNYTSTDFNKLNGFLYNTLKEEIIRKDDILFYQRNYSRMYCEIDARLAGVRGQAEYLAYLGVPESQIIEGDDTSLRECYEYAKEIERKNEEFAINKIDIDGNIVSVSEKVRELIKKNSEWIKKYPVLLLEYNDNGERKSTIQILQNALKNSKGTDGENLEGIYTKIFEANIKVDLKSAEQCLKFISKTIEENSYDRDKMLRFANLIIDNEILYSLSEAEKNSETFKKVVLELKKISQNHPDLQVITKVNESLAEFDKNGEFNYEQKIDKELSDTAIGRILQRKIKSIEDFDRILEDVSNLLSESDKSNWNIEWEFIQLFKHQVESKTKLDITLMLEKSIKIIPEYNRKRVIMSVIENMPADMQKDNIENFLNIFWKEYINQYEFEKLSDARQISMMIKPEIIENNPGFLNQIYKSILEPGELPFLKNIENAQEFEKAIQEAKEKGASNYQIGKGMKEIVKSEAKRGNVDSIEMLYKQLEYSDVWDKSGCISTFFIYAKDELKEQNVEEILRNILIEKKYFKKDKIEDIIESSIKYLRNEAFERDPKLKMRIEEIKVQAMEDLEMEEIEDFDFDDDEYLEEDNGEVNIEENAEEKEDDNDEEKNENVEEKDDNNEKENKDNKQKKHDEISRSDARADIRALQTISESVSLQEKTEGKNSIKAFILEKLRKIKRKTEDFLKGGKNHGDR